MPKQVGFINTCFARILTPPASKKCQAQADQHMAAEAETLQTRWDMKEEIRGPIEKGAFISAPSSFCSIKCQGNTLLTSYLPNNDHNQKSSLLWWPLWAGWIALPGMQRKKKTPLSNKAASILSFCPAALWKFCILPRWSAQQRNAERFIHSNWDIHFGLDSTKPLQTRCARTPPFSPRLLLLVNCVSHAPACSQHLLYRPTCKTESHRGRWHSSPSTCGKARQKNTFGRFFSFCLSFLLFFFSFKVQHFHTRDTSFARAAEMKERALLLKAAYGDNAVLNLET